MNGRTVFVLAIVVFLQTLVVAADTAMFFGLGDLEGGYFSSSAYGVSRDGLAVLGRSRSALGMESFRWTANDGMTGLGDLDGRSFFGTSFAASAGGAVVAGHSRSSPGYDDEEGMEAFRWTEADGMVGLGTLGGIHLYSGAYGISADGSIIVGWSGLKYGTQGREAFLWTAAGGMVGLGDLHGGEFYSYAIDVSADGAVVVGASKSAFGADSREAFRWTADDGMVGLGRLEGDSEAHAVSADGSVVVGSSGTDSRREAFRWTEQSGMAGLGDLPGNSFYSNAYGVSADGSIVVGRCESVIGYEAFIWDEANGMRSLKEVLTNDYGLHLGDWRLNSATAISDDGRTIVGYGYPPPINNPEAWIVILPGPKVVYVDADATGANNGQSWADAYTALGNALDVVSNGDEIRVAQGTYRPNDGIVIIGDHRELTFQLKNDVAVKGGYAGFGEPDPDTRHIKLYETILSGDLLGNDEHGFVNNDENSYHIVTGSGTNSTAVLDGFTVTGGNANGPHQEAVGGGMYMDDYSSPTVLNCIFTANSAINGAGMFIEEGGTSTLKNCIFSANSARNYGGGMFAEDECDLILTNCTFTRNLADYGAGMYNFGGDLSRQSLTNCTFYGNSAHSHGGGIYNTRHSSSVLTNCILWLNVPDEIYPNEGPAAIVSYSDIQGGWPGVGNIDADPLFANPHINDFHLKSQAGRYDPAGKGWAINAVTSSCIDAGATAGPIGHEPFPNGGRINMGAYGGTKQASKSYFGKAPCRIIIAGDINGDCTVDLLDFVIMANHWLWEK